MTTHGLLLLLLATALKLITEYAVGHREYGLTSNYNH